MDDDNDYGAGRGGPLRTEADRLLQAKYHQKERERRKRNALSRLVDVLDDVAPQRRPRPHHLADVASFYGVHPRAVLTVLRRHREEFESDGWRESDPHRHVGDYWPDQAVVRAGLLLERSAVADQLRHLLGRGHCRWCTPQRCADQRVPAVVPHSLGSCGRCSRSEPR